MNKEVKLTQRRYFKDRHYLITICDKIGLKVGCVLCERDCVYFDSIDIENQIVSCKE